MKYDIYATYLIPIFLAVVFAAGIAFYWICRKSYRRAIRDDRNAPGSVSKEKLAALEVRMKVSAVVAFLLAAELFAVLLFILSAIFYA